MRGKSQVCPGTRRTETGSGVPILLQKSWRGSRNANAQTTAQIRFLAARKSEKRFPKSHRRGFGIPSEDGASSGRRLLIDFCNKICQYRPLLTESICRRVISLPRQRAASGACRSPCVSQDRRRRGHARRCKLGNRPHPRSSWTALDALVLARRDRDRPGSGRRSRRSRMGSDPAGLTHCCPMIR